MQRRGLQLSSSDVTTVLRLRGPIAASDVDRAVAALVDRHPALRLVVEQNSKLSPDERLNALADFGRTGVFRPGMYLAGVGTSATMLSSRLEQIADDEHLLYLTADHLVTDALSMKLIRRELATLLTGGSLEPLTPIDYAGWQHAAIADGTFAGGVAYWKEQWDRFSQARIGFEDLPFSLPRPQQSAFPFGVVKAEFDREITHAIRAHARKSRVTLYAWLLAVFARVLQDLTGKTKLGVWCHFSNRTRPEVQNAVGWFAHTHLLGIDLEADDLLPHCRQVVARAAEHQEVPVMHVWSEMGGYPRHPDAKVLLDLSLADDPLPRSETLSIEHAAELSPAVGRFAGLGLYVRDNRDTLDLSVQYLEDRFPKPAMEQFLAGFQNKARHALANP